MVPVSQATRKFRRRHEGQTPETVFVQARLVHAGASSNGIYPDADDAVKYPTGTNNVRNYPVSAHPPQRGLLTVRSASPLDCSHDRYRQAIHTIQRPNPSRQRAVVGLHVGRIPYRHHFGCWWFWRDLQSVGHAAGDVGSDQGILSGGVVVPGCRRGDGSLQHPRRRCWRQRRTIVGLPVGAGAFFG